MGLFGFGKGTEGVPTKRQNPLEGRNIPNWANPVVGAIHDSEFLKTFALTITPVTINRLEQIAAELIDETNASESLNHEFEMGGYHKVGARFVEKVLTQYGDDREFLLEAAQILTGPFGQRVTPIHERVDALEKNKAISEK